MPIIATVPASRGCSRVTRVASASSARMPPSPPLSNRSTTVTYLSDTISVIDQNIIDSTASTLASVSGRPWGPLNASLNAYKGLVPMSPYTTPRAPRVRTASVDLPLPEWDETVSWAIESRSLKPETRDYTPIDAASQQ